MSDSPEHYARLMHLLEAALQRPPHERQSYLRAETANDGQLFDQVARLIELAERHNGPLQSTALGAIVRGAAIDAMDAPRIESALQSIGPFRIVRAIGEGRHARVYLAEQDAPIRRQVAIKVLSEGVHSTDVLARFAVERQALARMNHPNIAAIVDAGALDDGRPYFVMEYVDGPPITRHCTARAEPPGERVRLMAIVCAAVQHAHQNGVIHRDLSPNNILVVERDGTAMPKVIDFGVARAIDPTATELATHTVAGQIVGTPGYMSPEQLMCAAVDTRSDVYSLGAVLYELLARRPPFDIAGQSLADIRRITETGPPRLRTLDPRIPADLDAIAAKALQHDRATRYQNAGELGVDLERYLRGEPIAARPPAVLYTLWTLAQRNRTAALAVALLSLTVLAALAIVTVALGEAARQQRIARDAAKGLLRDGVNALTSLKATAVARRQLFGSIRQHTGQFVAENRDDPETQQLYAEALHAMGDLEVEEGNLSEAEAYRKEELAIFERLAAEHPDDPEIQADWSISLVKIGDLKKMRGHFEDARGWYERAMSIDERLVAQHHDHRGLVDNLCWSYVRLGHLATLQGRFDHAIRLYQRIEPLVEPLLRADADDVGALRIVYEVHGLRVELAAKVGDYTGRAPHAREALRAARRLVELQPEDRHHRRHLANAMRAAAFDYTRVQPLAEIEETFIECIATLETLVKSDPDDIEMVYVLASCLSSRGPYHARAGRLEAARADTLRSIELAQSLLSKDRSHAGHRRLLAHCHAMACSIEPFVSDPPAARAHAQAAVKLWRQLADAPDPSVEDVRAFCRLLINCPVEDAHDPSEALRRLTALVSARSITEPGVLRELAMAHYWSGDTTAAIELLESVLSSLPADDPLRPTIEQDLALYRSPP